MFLVQRILEARMARSGGSMPHVNVSSHGRQQHAAWCAAACSPNFCRMSALPNT